MRKLIQRLSPQATANFGLVLVVIILNGIIVYRNTIALHATQGWVSHTQEVLGQIEALFSTLKDAESNARAYVITGDDLFLNAHQTAANGLTGQFQKLTGLVSDNNDQMRRLEELSRRVESRLSHLRSIVDARTKRGFEGGREGVQSGEGLIQMDGVRKVIDELKGEENRLLPLRTREAGDRRNTVLTANIVAVITSVVITAAAWYLIGKELEKRRRAEAIAHAERQNLLATLTSIGDAVIVTDAKGRVTLVNSLAHELIGRRDDMIGKSLTEIFTILNASTRVVAKNPVEKVLEFGKVVGSENDTLLVRPDGTEVPVENSAAPIRDRSGRIIGIVLVFRDCSERQRFQEAAKAREHRFRRMFETPLIGIAVGNSAGYLEEANDAYLDLIGYRRGELDESLLSWGGVPVGKSPLSDSAQLELIETGVCKPFERTYRNAQAEDVPVLVSAARLLDPHDRIVVYVTDLTESKRAEAALRESESRFRVLSECMPQKVWTARPDGQLDYLNRMLIEYAGLPNEQLTGWGWLDLIHPDDRQAHMDAWKHAVSTGQMFEIEHRLRKSTGEYRWHLARALPIYARETEIRMWLGTNTDIHDQKLAEESLREEHRRKDHFLAVLAHELRNPLAPLSNAVQVFSDVRHDPGRSAELLAVMKSQLRQMIRLIDDLLDLARITQGRIQLCRSRTSVQEAVAVAVEAVQPMIVDRQHQLTVTLPQQELWLDADPVRLAQILTNLLHNAAKYTNSSGKIVLAVERTESELLFRVRDNGLGISPEMLRKVFELFMQAEQTLDRAHGGLGIGLTLVRTLVELHGGSVTAHSDGPGRGSEFIVRFPLSDISPSPMITPPVATELASTPLPTLRVLVVDDVRASAKTLAIMLRVLGQDAEVAFDGPTAIARAFQERFDVIFLDIAMPGMDGLAVARELRKQPELHSLMLVAVTGFGQHDDRQRSIDAGFDAHLVKPTSLDLLREILQQAATGRDATQCRVAST